MVFCPQNHSKKCLSHFTARSEVPVCALGDRAVQEAKGGRQGRNISCPDPLPQCLFWGLTLLPRYTLLESFCITEPQWWQAPWPLQTIFLSTGLRWESRETNLKIDAGRQPTHQAIGYFQTWLVLSSEHKLDQMWISATFLTVKEHHIVVFFSQEITLH